MRRGLVLSRFRWNLRPPVPEGHPLRNGLPPLLGQLVYNRGLSEPAQVKSFLAGDAGLAGDPFLLPDMPQAVSRLYRALLSGETIAIFGDYDTDGATSTALLTLGLSRLGAVVIPYIPNRFTEGYGLTSAALERLAAQGVSLVITVDCGITSLAEIKGAGKMGLDVIVTDHHTPLAELPPALAVVNPRLSTSVYPFPELAGVGVACKLLQALLRSLGREESLEELADLAALGTIADLSPLVGENRYLVKKGLKLLNGRPRPGLKELMTQCGLSAGEIDAEKIAWVIAPCLNAAGRLEHALTSYKLLTTDSAGEAAALARQLCDINTERQKMTADTFARARERVMRQAVAEIIFSADPANHIGITGLVAGRLCEEFYRPSFVIRTGEEMSTGSARSIPEFNVVNALGECAHLLSRFGGHSQAAGFTVPTSNLEELERSLTRLAGERLAGIDLRPALDIDRQLSLNLLAGDTYRTIRSLAPFGRGNPCPVFLSRGVETLECASMGNGQEHLRFKLKQDGIIWDGVGFRLGNYLGEAAGRLDIVYNLEVDSWGGVERLRLNVLDFQAAVV
ncbi:MAG: single-stranded-DNA-specific exonuclease RecJ [Chloroflexi bacterium]|nr:single-stranded-DNA-specific exonuclease RecJ [Chloroflexota bacterium]